MRKLISASAIERIVKCPGSLRLEHSPYDSEYSDAGRERHKKLEDMVNAGTLPDGIDPGLIPIDAETEVAFALNVATGEVIRLELTGHRSYPDLGPFWIYGTADVVGTEEGVCFIVDYKGHKWQTAAYYNLQLRTLALMATRWSGSLGAVVVLAYCSDEDDSVKIDSIDRASLGDAEFEEHLALLRSMFLADNTKLSRGDHCQYCNAWLSCDVQRNAALDMLMLNDGVKFNVDEMVQINASAKLAAERTDAELQRIVEQDGPVATQAGKLVIKQLSGRRSFADIDKAYEIAKRFAPSLADVAFVKSLKSTMSAIDKIKVPAMHEALTREGAIKISDPQNKWAFIPGGSK